MNAKIIKSEEDYEEALARVDELMDLDPEPESLEGQELELLAVLIERFEDEMYPMDFPDPIEAIKFRMEQEGLTQTDIAPLFGGKPKASEVLNGKRSLSIAMMRNLHEKLGIPAEVLLQDPSAKELPKRDIEVKAFPIAEMLKEGYFRGFSGTAREAKAVGEELLSGLLSVFGDSKPQPVYCRSSKSKVDENALLAWQAKAMSHAKRQALPPFEKASIMNNQEEFSRSIVKLSYLKEGPKAAVEFLNKKGIHVVIQKHLSKTYLDGACFLLAKNRPVIGLTLRYDRLDNFWFTLMHELGHLLLHLDSSERCFFDDTKNVHQSTDRFEEEANAFAEKALIPEEKWSAHKGRLLAMPTKEEVCHFADWICVHPAVIAGRIEWEKDNYSLFPKRLLGQGQVRSQLAYVS